MAFELATGTAASALDGSERIPILQGGGPKAATTEQILAYIKGAYYPQVATWADLPAAFVSTGDIYVVQTTTGLIGFRKLAGLWRSNGSTWDYLGNIYLTAADTPFTPTGTIAAANVQDAIAELDTEKLGLTVTTRSSSYTETATSGIQVILVTGASVVVTLPSAIGNTAQFNFKLTVTGTMTLNATGGQTIDGGSSAVTSVQYTSIALVSDGANWQVI